MQAIEEVREGRISFLAAGKKYGVSHMTLYRYYLSMGYRLCRKSNRTYSAYNVECLNDPSLRPPPTAAPSNAARQSVWPAYADPDPGDDDHAYPWNRV